MAVSFSRPLRPLAALALTLLLLSACGGEPPAKAPSVPTVSVTTVQVEDLPLALRYPARVAGSRVVEVRAQVSGKIVERVYREGQPVTEGDVLFRIDAAPYQAAYDEAAAQRAVRQAALTQARSDYERIATLVERGAVSRREFDQSSAALEQAEAALDAAEATQRSARLNLDYTAVRAPVSALFISPRMCARPPLACSSAVFMISCVMPATLMSIWSEVMPFSEPATLKSMSPR